jgi:uncharacterized protein (DUF1015 family)
MPQVFPFRAVQYSAGPDVSSLIAPPYDVLDAAAKQRLLDKNAKNIVAIDLPHTPAKELGPPQAYQNAADMYRAWLAEGTLKRLDKPAIFAYRETTKGLVGGGQTSQRCGMACCVETVPFGPRQGGGILPHEETFSGPKEDRFALMKATRAQLSPIFGLHADEQGRASRFTRQVMATLPPDISAEILSPVGDSVLHEVWTIRDAGLIKQYQDAMIGEDIFIADGHHRYTTGLNYLNLLQSQGTVGPDHAARRCMMVLVGMSDPGLIIWPTHRVLGGMKDYSLDGFQKAAAEQLRFEPFAGDLHALEGALLRAPATANVLGIYDFATKRALLAMPMQADPLRPQFPDKPAAWRTLDVAIIQHLIVEKICQPKLNGGQPVKWAFPHTIKEVLEIGGGTETGAGGGKGFAQMAVIVRPTPLQAVKDVSRANQLMPQKSTFFYPKLATGLFVNPLE